MEVNGRFWGSLQLAIDAGVDFPFLACSSRRGSGRERPAAVRGRREEPLAAAATSTICCCACSAARGR